MTVLYGGSPARVNKVQKVSLSEVFDVFLGGVGLKEEIKKKDRKRKIEAREEFGKLLPFCAWPLVCGRDLGPKKPRRKTR